MSFSGLLLLRQSGVLSDSEEADAVGEGGGAETMEVVADEADAAAELWRATTLEEGGHMRRRVSLK